MSSSFLLNEIVSYKIINWDLNKLKLKINEFYWFLDKKIKFYILKWYININFRWL